MRNLTVTRHPFIAAIITFLVTIFMFTSINNQAAIADTSKDWVFYNQFVQQTDEIHYNVTSADLNKYRNFEDADSDNQEIFENVKNRLRDELGGYTDMCWDRFDQTQLVLCDTGNNYFDISQFAVLAFYHPETNTVYCIRNKLQALKDAHAYNYVLELLAHELIHSLTANEMNAESLINEGFTEYLAYAIYPPETGCPSYYYHYAFIDTLIKQVGIEVAMRAFLNGTIEDLIDNAIKQPGAMYNIQGPLTHTASGVSTDEEELIVLDVYAHYLKATQINDSATRDAFNLMLSKLEQTPRNITAKVYFEEMLPFSLTATNS